MEVGYHFTYDAETNRIWGSSTAPRGSSLFAVAPAQRLTTTTRRAATSAGKRRPDPPQMTRSASVNMTVIKYTPGSRAEVQAVPSHRRPRSAASRARADGGSGAAESTS